MDAFAGGPSKIIQQRLPSLDGWRAVAILLVVGGHLPYTIGFPASAWRFLENVFDGNLGVRIFFTISGFIITWLLLKEDATAGRISLKRFYTRRSLRILPVYWTYLTVLGIFAAIGRYHDANSSWIGALTFTRNVVGRGDSATVHFWSLAIEEQFYLGWPVAFKLFRLGKHYRRAFAALLLVVIAANLSRIYAGYFPNNLRTDLFIGAHSLIRYADCLALGCLAAFLRFGHFIKPIKYLTPLAWLLMILGLLVDHLLLNRWSEIAWLVPTLQGVGFTWLMLESIDQPIVYSILNTRSLISIGVVSYSLYVWQMLFLNHFSPGLNPAFLDHWSIWVFPSCLLAWLSYRILERPFIGLRSRLL